MALLQMTACGSDQDANLTKGEAFCRQASAMGAEVALFPEMCQAVQREIANQESTAWVRSLRQHEWERSA